MARIAHLATCYRSSIYTIEIQSLIKLINIESKSGKKWEILEIII